MPTVRARTGPADLLRRLATGGDEPSSFALVDDPSQWFGYVRWEAPRPIPAPESPRPPGVWADVSTAPARRRAPLRMPAAFAVLPIDESPDPEPDAERTEAEGVPSSVAPMRPDDPRLRPRLSAPAARDEDLCPRARLMPSLKHWLGRRQHVGLDVARLVDRVSRQQPVRRFPQRDRLAWPGRLLVLLDFGDGQWPYRFDMLRLVRWLRAEMDDASLRIRTLSQGPWGRWQPMGEPPDDDTTSRPQPGRWPDPGGDVLVVSDAALASDRADSPLADAWRRLLAALVDAGQQVTVLTTIGDRFVIPGRAVQWLHWSARRRAAPVRTAPLPIRSTADSAATTGRHVANLQDLIALVASTRRTDPALLRQFRRRIPGADADLEGRVWAHPDIKPGAACSVRVGRAVPHLRRFATLPAGLRRAADRLAQQHHGHLSPLVEHDEALLRRTWSPPGASDDPDDAASRSVEFFEALLAMLDAPAAPSAEWGQAIRDMLMHTEAADDRPVPRVLQRLGERVLARGDQRWVPSWYQEPPPDPGLPRSLWWLVQDMATGRVRLQREAVSGRQRLLDGPLHGSVVQYGPVGEPWRMRIDLSARSAAVDFGPCDDGKPVEWRIGGRHLVGQWLPRPPRAPGWRVDAEGVWMEVAAFGHPKPEEPQGALIKIVPRLSNGFDAEEATPASDVLGALPVPMESPHWVAEPVFAAFTSHDPAGNVLTTTIRQGLDRIGPWLDLIVGTRPQQLRSIDIEEGATTQRFRWIEPTTFLMGSPPSVGQDDERPQHEVTLTQGCWLADTPCTQAFWMAVMGGTNPSHFQDKPYSADCPVEGVSWHSVKDFLQHLTERLPMGFDATSPTEAEWEAACRAGTQTAYAWGDEVDVARANVGESDVGETTPVKTYPPNAWGLHDMHGNVWEWCADGFRTYFDRHEVDPVGDAAHGAPRVVRGGSWLDDASGARSASRFLADPGRDFRFQGFRVTLRFRSQRLGQPGVYPWVPRRAADSAAAILHSEAVTSDSRLTRIWSRLRGRKPP